MFYVYVIVFLLFYRAKMWKESFDAATQVVGEPPFPVALLINHMDGVPEDDPQRLTNLELQAGDQGSYYAIYHVSLGN